MEPTAVESASGLTAAGIALVSAVAVFLILSVGAVLVLRRAEDSYPRAIGLTLAVGVFLLVTALTLGAFETVPAAAATYLLAAVMFLIATGVWAIVLADAAMNESSSGNDKVAWLIVIVFAGPVGATLYLVLRRPQRKIELGR